MSAAQIPGLTSDEFSRCDERDPGIDHRNSQSSDQKTDAAIKAQVDRSLWNDDVLRAIESYEMVVHVKHGILYLSGHIVNTTSKSRIDQAIRAVPGILGIQNDLVLDDQLTRQVAGSLGTLEHTYGCKFFTGASHGVISLNGTVSHERVKSLAEKQVSSTPNVRGVINNVLVSGAALELPEPAFLQPTIGQTIYFRDGISGVVKQVIINPDNRLVVAMTVRAQFANRQQELHSLNSGTALSPERLVVVPMDAVRHMTKVSGFLHINSDETNRYMDFDSASFRTPNVDWSPPYPYCPTDVLLAVEKRPMEFQVLQQAARSPFVVAWVEQPLSQELLANDSLGG